MKTSKEFQTRETDQGPLGFVFLVTERSLRPLQDSGVRSGEAVFVRSVPGDVCAWAPTKEQAVQRLRAVLDLEFGDDPRGWWQKAIAKTEPNQLQILAAKLVEILDALQAHRCDEDDGRLVYVEQELRDDQVPAHC